MNKAEREKLTEEVDIFAPRYVNEMLLKLTKYVDTLEAAAERARGIAGIMSSSGAREIFTILSEALDKGK